jgi:hypothetical protein
MPRSIRLVLGAAVAISMLSFAVPAIAAGTPGPAGQTAPVQTPGPPVDPPAGSLDGTVTSVSDVTALTPDQISDLGSDVAFPQTERCWSMWFGYGTFSTPKLYGKTNVSWCSADGHYLNYATSNCDGYENWPTYRYMSCTDFPNYGAGWNIYTVRTDYTLCTAWITYPVGSCALDEYPWESYEFLATGRFVKLGGWR